MKFLTALSLKSKLIGAFIFVTIIPVAVITYIGITTDAETMLNDKISSLKEITHIKSLQLEQGLQSQFNSIETIAATKNTANFTEALKTYHLNKNIGDDNINTQNSNFRAIIESEDDFFTEIISRYDYQNFYILCATHGHVLYELDKRILGINISKGSLSNSGLTKIWKKILNTRSNAMVDFSYFEPFSEPAAFLGVPILDDQTNEIIAVMAIQIGHNKITDIVELKETDFASQEVYLAGEDGYLRSDSRFDTESAVLKRKIENEAFRNAINGKEGAVIATDYRGIDVISAYERIDLKDVQNFGADFNWVIFADIDESEISDEIISLIYKIILISIILLILVAIAGTILARNISNPIVNLSNLSQKIGQGDLTIDIQKVKGKDEVSILTNSFANMVTNLRGQVSKLVEGTSVLVSSTSQISSTISELSASSNQTVSAVNETSTTVDEVKQTAKVAKERANEVTKNSEKAKQDSADGEAAAIEMTEKIGDIKNKMSVIAESITELSEQGASIGEIMNTINELAEQSNLLAVNAAIEAAKAGEKGKGFAIVANEVRSLAEQSKQATQQVRTILNDVQKAAGKSVMATEEGGKTVDAGVEYVGIALEKIKMLASAIENASDSAFQIAASSQQQFVGIDQINTAVKSISDASSQNLTSAQQLDTAAKNLKDLGEEIKEVISYYKV